MRKQRNRNSGSRSSGSARRRRRGPSIGDCFEAAVRDLSASGDGIVAHPNGQVFFVPGVWPREKGRFRITALRGRHGRAEVLDLEANPAIRREAPCPHHGFGTADCGGCPWQFADYGAQLEAKANRVEQALRELDLAVAIAPIHAAPETLGYRNRAQLKTDGRQLGYVARGSNALVPIDVCPILNSPNRRTLETLLKLLPRRDWRPARGQRWTRIDIDDAIDASEVVAGERRPFRQGNSAQNAFMRNWLESRLNEIKAASHVVELFAGSGNFTEVLSTRGGQSITAIDSFVPALSRLEGRALPGVEVLCLDLGSASFPELPKRAIADADLLVLDPPREGFRHLGECVARAPKLGDVVYVSCDPASFARDIEAVIAQGFVAREIQPIDLFPHTPHVELLTWFARNP